MHFFCENNQEGDFVFGDYTEMKGDFSEKKVVRNTLLLFNRWH
jgi:hypothetical protein